MSTGISDFLILVLGRGRRRWSFVKVMMSTLVSREQSRWWCFDAVEQIYKVFSNKAECYKCSQIPHHCCINGKMGCSLEQNPMLFWKKILKRKLSCNSSSKHVIFNVSRLSLVFLRTSIQQLQHNSSLKQRSRARCWGLKRIYLSKRPKGPRRCNA